MNVDGCLGPPGGAERERLVMYPVGIIKEVMDSKDRLHSVNHKDAKLCAVGEIAVVAWLFKRH